MKIILETEEKNKKITIPTAFGEKTIEALRVTVVKVNQTPVYSVFYTRNGDFIASIPPTIVKINDPINFSELFTQKKYGNLAPALKRTIIPAMASAAGYTDIEKFLEERLIRIEVEDYTEKDHPEEILSNSIIITARIGNRSILSAWKKIKTPTAPTLARFIIPDGLTIEGEKDYLQQTLDELKHLPLQPKEKIIEYARKYLVHIAKENLKAAGVL